MGTLLLLVLFAVVWAGVGVHWLRSRRPLDSLGLAGLGRNLLASDRSPRTPIVPLRGPRLGAGARPHTPGYSLTERARTPVAGLRSAAANHAAKQGQDDAAPQPGATRPRATRAVLDPATGWNGRLPPSPEQAAARRRIVLLTLAGAAFLTLVIAIVGGLPWLLLHLLVDAALLAYIAALVQYHREVEAAHMQAAPLVPARPAARLVTTGRR